MKSNFLFSVFVIHFSLMLHCQGQWTQKANFGGGNRGGTANLTIGNFGYVCGGSDNSNFYDDLWEYDPQNDAWSQKASMAGIRENPVAFSIGSVGYVGTGYGMASLFYSDFWAWDQTTNVWSQISDYPGEGGSGLAGGVAFAIGNKGYVGTGGGWGSSSLQTSEEFWEYDPSSDTWTRKADFAGGQRWGAIGFAFGNKGYIGTGNYATSFSDDYYNDFWEYDPVGDNWTQKANIPDTTRNYATGFAIGSKCYVGTGCYTDNLGSFHNDLWEWSPTTNTWVQMTSYPGVGRVSCCSFAIGPKGYLGMGGSVTGLAKKDFWEFDPSVVGVSENEYTEEVKVYPNPARERVTFQFSCMSESRSIAILDQTGKEIWREENQENSMSISLNGFSNGAYFYQVEENGITKATGKLIVE